MRNKNFYGKRISFNIIILILISVYFSVEVMADTECRDYNEYCSGLSQKDQGSSPYGSFCYYKDYPKEADNKDNQACFDRCVARLRSEGLTEPVAKNKCASNKCWKQIREQCLPTEECKETGCEPKSTTSSGTSQGDGGGSTGGTVPPPGQESGLLKPTTLLGDFNDDKCVDMSDFRMFEGNFGKSFDSNTEKYDLSKNKKIDYDDFFIFGENFGEGCSSGKITISSGESLVMGDKVDQYKEAFLACPDNKKIVELEAYYFCPNDAINEMRYTTCPLKVVGNSGLQRGGGIGFKDASYRFDGSACSNDPCYGVVKKGRLIAKCSQQITQPAGDIPKDRETETLPQRPSETKQGDITVRNIPAISAPKLVASVECINDTRFDFSNNTKVDMDDYFLFAENFDKKVNDSFVGRFDLDNDAHVDFDDFFLFSEQFGKDICKEALGDGRKSNLNNCNEKCSDFDGCSCGANQSSTCVYQTAEHGQTCGGEKPEEKNIVEKIVEVVKNIFVEPNHCEDGIKNKDEDQVDCGGKDCKKCLEAKEKSKVCKNLGYGEKCEVEFKVKVNAGKGSGVNLPVVFEYKGKKIVKDSVLAVSGVKSSSEVFAVTGSTVWDVGFTDVTGNVVQDTTTGSTSRFNCVLKNRPEICCPFGFRVSSQDPQQCVRDEIVVVPKRNLYDRFLELAQKYLSAKGGEKESIKEELRNLE